MIRPTFPVCLAGVLAVLLCGDACAQARQLPATHATARVAVIGGVAAAGGAYPSLAEVVDLRGREAGQCTGTVVAPSLVLTAGHCAENMRTGIPRRASGFRILTFAGAEMHVSTVNGVIVYERFARRVDDGDAALLVLSAPVSAPAIKLAGGSDGDAPAAGTTATIVGWGNTRYRQRLPTGRLRSATTVVQAARWCSRNAPPFYLRGEICTIDPPGYATGACNGDSGGPLLVAGSGGEAPVQVGIAIHVYGKCSTRRPTVFTSVESIVTWVDSWIAAYQARTS